MSGRSNVEGSSVSSSKSGRLPPSSGEPKRSSSSPLEAPMRRIIPWKGYGRSAVRDFQTELAPTPFWDQDVEAIFEANGEALVDRPLQCREEVQALCEFIEAHRIRSYLEIGVWTGRLVSLLH